ncbi:DinB family protein [Paenibacillus sp. MMS20-IR301]|uniref:DinB family protein n=1 Tax=Paenibacillus sp. MMS20-IR301 TaxID=2895946 RepID=UPI0028E38343|nr:DinB family protein [Paenibacillus sp. MMS20-IR301]WNS41643.1 DinB family protein [Paenibacillus sp. MMS20-IR301]
MDQTQRKNWNENHKVLTGLLSKPQSHAAAVSLFLELHTALYASGPAGAEQPGYEDLLWHNIRETTLRSYPVHTPGSRNSIVWHLWHSARIEDITMNILGADREQVMHSDHYAESLQTSFIHSGNGMSEQDVARLSAEIQLEALAAYRHAVAVRTRSFISATEPGQFATKATPAQFLRIREEQAVLESEQWLLDYWGGKTLAGLILMPATRHNFVHLNKAMRAKQKLQPE